jgi:hypothetical protein
MTWDILIRRGTVIDGCGSPGTSAILLSPPPHLQRQASPGVNFIGLPRGGIAS